MPKPVAIPHSPILLRCPLGCGARREGIQDGVAFYECGTLVEFHREKPKIRARLACIGGMSTAPRGEEKRPWVTAESHVRY